MALFAKERAAHGHFLPLGIGRHMQPFVEICFFVRFDFFNQQTERARQGAHVDLVHLFAAGQFQKTLEHRTADGIAGHFGSPAPIGDDQALVAFRRQLREQASKLFAEVQIRFDQCVGLGVEIWQIDRVAHSAVHQIVGDRLGYFNADVFLRLLRARAEMRRHDHLRQIAQGKFFGRRLRFINVQRRAGYAPALDRVVKVLLMDDAASGAVEHAHPFLHLRERRGVDHPTRLVAHRHMDGDEISAGVNFV